MSGAILIDIRPMVEAKCWVGMNIVTRLHKRVQNRVRGIGRSLTEKRESISASRRGRSKRGQVEFAG